MGLTKYDGKVFIQHIQAISIPDDGILEFVFCDGHSETVTWENRSRRESWTDEMKAAAREKRKGGDNNAKR